MKPTLILLSFFSLFLTFSNASAARSYACLHNQGLYVGRAHFYVMTESGIVSEKLVRYGHNSVVCTDFEPEAGQFVLLKVNHNTGPTDATVQDTCNYFYTKTATVYSRGNAFNYWCEL